MKQNITGLLTTILNAKALGELMADTALGELANLTGRDLQFKQSVSLGHKTYSIVDGSKTVATL